MPLWFDGPDRPLARHGGFAAWNSPRVTSGAPCLDGLRASVRCRTDQGRATAVLPCAEGSVECVANGATSKGFCRPQAGVGDRLLSGCPDRRIAQQTGTLHAGTTQVGAQRLEDDEGPQRHRRHSRRSNRNVLIGVNILHPWQGLHFTASSDLELWITVILTALASAVCLWRLMTGSGPTDELRRFGAALGRPDDFS